MDTMRKKRMKTMICWCCLGALVLGLAVMPLVAKQNVQDDGPVATVRTAQAEENTLTEELRGGGTLSAPDAQEITLPTGIKLTGFLVKNGDQVHEGDALATVDTVSVMTAIEQIQQTLEYLDSQIDSADTQSGTTRIQAKTAGMVKQIFAREGDSVQQVMLEYGALAVVSLDGCMAVDLETQKQLQIGTEVTVTLETGEKCQGRVDSRLGQTYIITIEDEGYPVDTAASVATKDGETLGSGKLYIHDPWKATAVYGTVDKIRVEEQEKVSKGTTLLTLSDTDTDAQQQILVGRRQEYEDTMARLFQIYQSGVLSAPCDGVVDGVEEDSTWLLADGEEGIVIQLLSNEVSEPQEPMLPEGDAPGETPPEETQPEQTVYTGLIAMVTQDETGALCYLTNGQTVSLSDPSQLTPEQKDPTAMTIPYAFSGTGYLYVISGGQLLLTATPAAAGQLVLICEDKLISLGTVEQGMSGTMPGGDMSTMMPSGITGDFSGGTTASFEPYDLTESTVLTVTPEDTMTLDISIDEQDISRISLGMEAQVEVTAVGGEAYAATVTDIGTASNSGGNSKFTVTLTMTRQGQMLPGMSASARLTLAEGETCLTVPTAALEDDGGECVVYTAYTEKSNTLSKPVQVQTGLSDGENTQILEGLEPGTQVYYFYYE